MSDKNNAAVCSADAGSGSVQPETLGDLLILLLDEASRLESLCWAVQPENRPAGMATAANDLRATIQQARLKREEMQTRREYSAAVAECDRLRAVNAGLYAALSEMVAAERAEGAAAGDYDSARQCWENNEGEDPDAELTEAEAAHAEASARLLAAREAAEAVLSRVRTS